MEIRRKYPSIRIAWEGCLTGSFVGIAVATAILLATWRPELPLLPLIPYLLLFVVLGGSVGAAASVWRYHQRVTVVETVKQAQGISAAETPQPQVLSKPQEIIQNAWQQAMYKYKHGQEPTRAMFEHMSVSQTIWNSGRSILRAMNLVTDDGWWAADWMKVERLLKRINGDDDNIMVPVVGERVQHRYVKFHSKAINNSYVDWE